MKLNKFLLLTASIAGLVFMSCENEMKQDPELDIVVTGDGVAYDGQTITVQKGTPITFQLGGENDFLTFFSGEAGSKYEYRERSQVATDQIESSKLTLGIKTEYGKLAMIDFKVLISKNFEGLAKINLKPILFWWSNMMDGKRCFLLKICLIRLVQRLMNWICCPIWENV